MLDKDELVTEGAQSGFRPQSALQVGPKEGDWPTPQQTGPLPQEQSRAPPSKFRERIVPLQRKAPASAALQGSQVNEQVPEENGTAEREEAAYVGQLEQPANGTAGVCLKGRQGVTDGCTLSLIYPTEESFPEYSELS